MKTITFLLLLFGLTLCVCFPAFAQRSRWVFIDTDAEGTSYFIDKTSRKVIGDKVRTWGKSVFSDGSFRVNLTEWNCAEEKYFLLDSTIYTPTSSFIEKDKGTEWRLVVPDTIGQMMYQIACGNLSKRVSKDSTSAGKMMVEIIVDKANLRDAPNINSRIIQEASIGDRFTLVNK